MCRNVPAVTGVNPRLTLQDPANAKVVPYFDSDVTSPSLAMQLVNTFMMVSHVPKGPINLPSVHCYALSCPVSLKNPPLSIAPSFLFNSSLSPMPKSLSRLSSICSQPLAAPQRGPGMPPSPGLDPSISVAPSCLRPTRSASCCLIRGLHSACLRRRSRTLEMPTSRQPAST